MRAVLMRCSGLVVAVGIIGFTPARASAEPVTVYVAPACSAPNPKPCGDDAASGKIDAPLATIDKAVKLAGANGEVHVAVGRYDGPITTGGGVSILGGYARDFKSHTDLKDDVFARKGRTPADYTEQTVLTNDHGDRVLTAKTASGGGTISDVVVVGPSLSGKTGRSSYAVVVLDVGRARLRRSKIIAGSGASGVDGVPGKPNPESYCSKGGDGGFGRVARILASHRWIASLSGGGHWEDEYDLCESLPGGEGDTITDPTTKRSLAFGGTGGAKGWGPCNENNRTWSDGESGSAGSDGQRGFRGRGGASVLPENALGQFVARPDLVWMGPTGIDGGVGWSGAGGGGGGAGGSRYDYWHGTSCPTRTVFGGAGGHGGQGGCGGLGGTAGGSGGSSFAIVLFDATIVEENVAIVLGHGGTGGAGGAGAGGNLGQTGQPSPTKDEERRDKCMASSAWSGKGSGGGRGGDGGPGGGGAGGNGGLAVGVAKIGKAALIVDTGRHSASGGTGGTGGPASFGDAGHPGSVLVEQAFAIGPDERH